MAKAKSKVKQEAPPPAPPPRGNRDLLLLVDALSREKNVPKDIVFTALAGEAGRRPLQIRAVLR